MRDDSLEDVVQLRVRHLDAVFSGLGSGLVVGLGLFVATNWLILKGGPVVGPHLRLLGQFLPGYAVTFAGSLVGLAYGFGGGFIAGYLVSSLYNRIVQSRASALG